MPQFTQQQREEFLGHIMASGKFSKDEAFMMLREAEGQPVTNLTMDKPLAEQALDFASGMAPIAGAVTGAVAAPALTERFLPNVAKYIPRPIVSGVGQAVGNFVGNAPNMARGRVTPTEAAKQSVGVGAAGATTEGVANLITRGLASMGGVQSPAVNEALQRFKTVLGKPTTTAEAELGSKIANLVEPGNVGVTEGRITTEKLLSQQEAAGKMIDIRPTLDALNKNIARLQAQGLGGDARVALGKLTRIRTDLTTKYLGQPEGSGRALRLSVSPSEADSINAQLQDAIGNAYGRAGAKESVRALKDVQAAHTASFRTQTQTAESAAATGKRLTDIENLRDQINQKSPETFVRSVGDAIMTHGETGDQTALIALRNFDPSGKLEAQIRTLASKREWTGSQSRVAHNIKWEFIRRLPRFLAKIGVVTTKPAGVVAGAATSAFQQAMSPSKPFDPMANP